MRTDAYTTPLEVTPLDGGGEEPDETYQRPLG